MKPSTRRRLENGAANSLVFAAVGLRLGLFLYDRAAFFLPGVTVRRLREAERAARQERAA